MPSPWTGPRVFDTPERMDADAVDPGQLTAALAFIRRVNGLLGYTRATVAHFDRLVAAVPSDRPLTVLDVATGSADVPLAVHAWAERRGRAVHVTGLDLHAGTLAAAGAHVAATGPRTAARVALVRGDALSLPYADATFDVVMTSMFLHHLPDTAVVGALSEMRRVARHAMLVADLIRDVRAYGWISLLTLGGSPLLRHDARLSVRQAFTLDEIRRLAARAGWYAPKVTRHFGHRFVMTARV